MTFLKIDVDKSELSSLANQYDVSVIPAIFFIKDGKMISSVVGANLSEIHTKLKALLS